MSTIAIPLDQWEIRYHEAMAAILRAQETIRREAGIVGLAWSFWDVTRDLKYVIELQRGVHETMLAFPVPVPPDLIETHILSTAKLVRSIEELLDRAKRARLTSRTLTAPALELIRKRGEAIAEYLDGLKLSIDPEVEEQIRQGRQDFAQGRGVSLDSLLNE